MIYKTTVGADFLTKEIDKGNDKIHLQLWDTAGSERYQSVSAGFYRNSELCVLVFDQTDIESFQNVEMWRQSFLETLNPPEGDKYPFILLGNKNDLKEGIKIKKEAIDKYCQAHNNMPYFSVSAQLNNNIDEAFNKVAELALARNTQNEDTFIPEAKPLVIEKPKKEKKCC